MSFVGCLDTPLAQEGADVVETHQDRARPHRSDTSFYLSRIITLITLRNHKHKHTSVRGEEG